MNSSAASMHTSHGMPALAEGGRDYSRQPEPLQRLPDCLRGAALLVGV